MAAEIRSPKTNDLQYDLSGFSGQVDQVAYAGLLDAAIQFRFEAFGISLHGSQKIYTAVVGRGRKR